MFPITIEVEDKDDSIGNTVSVNQPSPSEVDLFMHLVEPIRLFPGIVAAVEELQKHRKSVKERHSTAKPFENKFPDAHCDHCHKKLGAGTVYWCKDSSSTFHEECWKNG